MNGGHPDPGVAGYLPERALADARQAGAPAPTPGYSAPAAGQSLRRAMAPLPQANPLSAPPPGEQGITCGPCVARLSSPADRMSALRAAIEEEPEPLVALTHLLHLCRDDHRVLWERVAEPVSRSRVATVMDTLAEALPEGVTDARLTGPVRRAMAAALQTVDGVAPVVVAHALAQFLDDRYGHTFPDSFRRRSPYQPGVGDPVPLGGTDLRVIMDMRPTSPAWRLANRLDETRRIRLAGEWAVGFRIVLDYSLFEILDSVVTADTVIATCHPNRTLAEFALPQDTRQPVFPVEPADPTRQLGQINRLISAATVAGADIVVLPELCVTEELAVELQDWVRRSDGPQILVAGSFHHADDHGRSAGRRRRNTAVAWVRGHPDPLLHDKHSPADRPVVEDIQPDGWPELRLYVTADGWHLVVAICRDLLNPQAVHAMTEAGANLVLVPAMSETLVPFGGPAAHLVGSDQALVAVANNPGGWRDEPHPLTRPGRALFGHPGFGQQTRLVHGQNTEPGIALLRVRSGQIQWIPADPLAAAPRPTALATPSWVTRLIQDVNCEPAGEQPQRPVTLRPAAVLVLLIADPTGPRVLLTQRAPDLSDYPDLLVFPGGAAEPHDNGPTATAIREATEEVGLDPATVSIIGHLPVFALPDSGFLVTPVLAWSPQPGFIGGANPAEVTHVCTVALHDLGRRIGGRPILDDATSTGTGPDVGTPDRMALGRITATVIDLLLATLTRAEEAAGAGSSSLRSLSWSS